MTLALAMMFAPPKRNGFAAIPSRLVIAGRNITSRRDIRAILEPEERAAAFREWARILESNKYAREKARDPANRTRWWAEHPEKRREYFERAKQDPDWLERQREAKRNHMRRKMADPEYRKLACARQMAYAARKKAALAAAQGAS